MSTASAATGLSFLYLLDTNILIHYVRRDALGQRMEATYGLLTAPLPPRISIVTEGEARAFALQNRWGAAKISQLTFLLSTFTSVALDFPGLIDNYASLDTYSRTVGRRMGKNDLWIAATTRVTGAKLLTTDADFDHLHPAFLDRDLVT